MHKTDSFRIVLVQLATVLDIGYKQNSENMAVPPRSLTPLMSWFRDAMLGVSNIYF